MAKDTLVGTVFSLSSKGLLVKAPRMVPIGTPIRDARGQPVGKVVDVVGPVAGPYLVISPAKGSRPPQPGREVYLP